MFLLLCQNLFAAEIFRFGPDNNMLFVEARVGNSDTPFLFQIDPGLSYSMLTENVTDSIALPTQSFRGNPIAKSSIQLDNQTMNGTFYVVEGSQNFPLWGGILGGDIMKEYVIDIHLQKNTISLYPQSPVPLDISFFNSQEGMITSVQVNSEKNSSSMEMKEIILQFDSTPYAIQSDTEILSSFLGTYQLPQPSKAQQNKIGIPALKGTRLVLDMDKKRMAIQKTASWFPPKRKSYTDVLKKRYRHLPMNDTSPKRVTLALIYINEGNIDKARDTLSIYLENVPDDSKAKEILHTLQINTSTFPSVLSEQEAQDLVSSKNWVSIINYLTLKGSPTKALAHAQTGVLALPNKAHTWVALSDAYLANNKVQEARQALAKAKTINKTPNAYITRTALLSFFANDKESAISGLRQQVRQPTQQEIEVYVYTRLFASSEYSDLFARDIASLPSPPSDFRILSYHYLDKTEEKEAVFSYLVDENCTRLKGHEQTNCYSWLNSLNGSTTANDLHKMTRVVHKHPYRSDYWDTMGNVYVDQKNPQKAKEAFFQAFLHDPDNPYMLFQYYWFSRL